ncbi:hypothetical protein FQR65_LT09297 [Abscondita terminalis]|nr:hypothetical protein FQR65_LT09297 [Abscondita terminalis]
MAELKLHLSFVVLLASLHTSFGCNGYQLIINRLANCNPNSIIKLDKFGVRLDDNCNLVPTGCIITTKGYNTAQVRNVCLIKRPMQLPFFQIHYVLEKPPLFPMEGTENLCTALTNATEITTLFQLPTKCPVKAGKICGRPDRKLSISQYKNRLPYAVGNLTMKADIKHNNGVSCINLHLTLKKRGS